MLVNNLEYDKIAKIKEQIDAIKENLTEIEFIEMLQELDLTSFFPKFPDSKNDIYHLLKNYSSVEFDKAYRENLKNSEVINPMVKRKEQKMKEKVERSKLQNKNKIKESLNFESLITNIEDEYRSKQFNQFDKFDEYFENEIKLKEEYKHITAQRAQIVTNIEASD
jgi:hypothetical protein